MVAVGDDPEFTTSGGSSGGTYNKAVPIYNPVSKLASEVAMDTTLNTDLILVGGPCANAVVKSLLNTAWSTEDSCAYWLADAQLGQEGKGMMKIVDNVFGSGKKALIIAGYSGADTRNLAKKAMNPTTFASMSGSEWIGSA
jgi:S-layer protein (TIGR01564 family)